MQTAYNHGIITPTNTPTRRATGGGRSREMSKHYDEDTFMEMVRDWKADNAPESDYLEMDELDISYDDEHNRWVASFNHEGKSYSLTDDGTGNIVIY